MKIINIYFLSSIYIFSSLIAVDPKSNVECVYSNNQAELAKSYEEYPVHGQKAVDEFINVYAEKVLPSFNDKITDQKDKITKDDLYRQIRRGARLVSRLLKGELEEVLNEIYDNKKEEEEAKLEHLNLINAIVWFLYAEAAQRGQAFTEGTFVIWDQDESDKSGPEGSNRKIYPFFTDYVQRVYGHLEPYQGLTPTLYAAYPRTSSHFKKNIEKYRWHLGIDLHSLEKKHLIPTAPNGYQHILAGLINPNQFYIKPEEYGMQTGDWLGHFVGAIVSKLRLLGTGGANEQPGMKKERFPEKLTQAIEKLQEDKLLPATQIDSISQLSEAIAPLDQNNETVQEIRRRLLAYDNIRFRHGNEVNFTNEDLSLASNVYIINDPIFKNAYETYLNLEFELRLALQGIISMRGSIRGGFEPPVERLIYEIRNFKIPSSPNDLSRMLKNRREKILENVEKLKEYASVDAILKIQPEEEEILQELEQELDQFRKSGNKRILIGILDKLRQLREDRYLTEEFKQKYHQFVNLAEQELAQQESNEKRRREELRQQEEAHRQAELLEKEERERLEKKQAELEHQREEEARREEERLAAEQREREKQERGREQQAELQRQQKEEARRQPKLLLKTKKYDDKFVRLYKLLNMLKKSLKV